MSTTAAKRVLAERAITKLSMAVYLTDDYSGRGGNLGDIRVSLKSPTGQIIPSTRNPDGYYLFLDLPENTYTPYTIQIEGGGYYFDKKKKNVIPAKLKKNDPVVNITLKPTPAYPFPPSATLVRGLVSDPEGRGIPDAVIKIKKKRIRTRTTEKGEFVIYFKGLKKDDVTTVNGKKLVKINGKNPVIIVRHQDYRRKRKAVKVVEGKTTSLKGHIILNHLS